MEISPAPERLYSDGTTYFGTLMNGQRTGKGKLMLTNGSTFIGNFLNGLPHGLGYLVFKNGSEFYGQFQRGKFHGFGMFRYKSGDKIEGYFDQGTPPRSGVFRSCHSRAVYEGQFQNGKLTQKQSDDHVSTSVIEVVRQVDELVQEYNTAQLT